MTSRDGERATACSNCTATTTNGLTLCSRCQQTLTVSLVNVAAYHTDVLRIQPGEKVKIRSTYKSAPPPSINAAYDPISEAADHVDSMLSRWVRRLRTDRPNIDEPKPGAVRLCAWLENHAPSIFTLPWAGELVRDILDAERNLKRILDRADTGWYAGKCNSELAPERAHDAFTCACSCHHDGVCDIEGGCGDEGTLPAVTCPRGLYATPGSNWIRCPECGATHDVRNRRNALLMEARDELAPIRTIAKVLVGLIDTEVSEERLAKRLDKWVERGQLTSLGVRVIDSRPRRVYRVGDVWDVLEREQKRAKLVPPGGLVETV